ncbi:MAG: discoidin domain-containing protein, partial [Chitinophagaceae bacterium]|nr:discoidin domain-containing protein [Chitinophagaceae bacterium]
IIEQDRTEEVDNNSIPTFSHNEFVFDESMRISFDSLTKTNLQIRYTTNGTKPDAQSALYTLPFDIQQSSEIHARYQDKQTLLMHPFESEAHFVKRPNHYKIKLASTYNPQYTAGGDAGLLDGLYGDIDWRKGRWQGFQAQDFEAVIDLGKVQTVNYVAANFLQDQKSWIFYPTQLEFFASTDNINWKLISKQAMNKLERDDERNTLTKLSAKTNLKARYIKVKAKNFGKIPDWHPGAGGDAFIFIDEIEIK